MYSRALLWASAKRLDPKALKQRIKIAYTVENDESDEIQLLEQSNGRSVAKVLNLPELAPELERAIRQVELAVTASKELEKEKKGLEAATQQRLEDEKAKPAR